MSLLKGNDASWERCVFAGQLLLAFSEAHLHFFEVLYVVFFQSFSSVAKLKLNVEVGLLSLSFCPLDFFCMAWHCRATRPHLARLCATRPHLSLSCAKRADPTRRCFSVCSFSPAAVSAAFASACSFGFRNELCSVFLAVEDGGA